MTAYAPPTPARRSPVRLDTDPSLLAYFDADGDPSNPRWYMVDLRLVRRFAQPVTLEMLRRNADRKLKDMVILRRGNRLSVTPVSEGEWKFINALAGD